MLLLTSTSDKLQVITSASGTVKVHASWVDNLSGTITPGRTNTATISGAATTDVVAAPAASTQRNVKFLVVRNDHATTSNGIVLQHTDGTNIESIWEGTLAAQEQIILDDRGIVTVFDALGIPKQTQVLYVTTPGDLMTEISNAPARFPAGSDWSLLYPVAADAAGLRWVAPLKNASVSAVSAGFATDTYLAGSNITIPSGLPLVKTKYRLKFDVTKTAAGVAAPVTIIRIGTTGSTADAAILTFTGNIQTAAADSGVIEVLASFRTVGTGTNAVLQGLYQLRHNLAVTGLGTVNPAGWQTINVTSAGFDSTTANLIIGASFNGGASFSGTVNLVEAELIP
jgi:hypothetical protein